MPTYARTQRFMRDHARLTAEQKQAFRQAVDGFVEALRTGVPRSGLRISGVQGAPGIFEMTWAPDGRATFQYGPPQAAGEAHIIWRRVGSHDIFGNP